MATFTAANAIRKISTGDESGTWGDSTNNNFDIIDRASNGFASIALTGTSFTLALSTTGVLSNGHYKAINFTGTPGGTCTVTLAQNDKPRVYMILNNTNQSVILTQGSGANVTIPTLKSAIVLANGAGSGAAVLDFTAQLNFDVTAITGVTAGTVAASKAVIVDSNKSITGFLNVTASGELEGGTLDINGAGDVSGALTIGSLVIGSANISEAELETIDGVTAGTVAASKAVVVNGDKDVSSFRNVTATGVVGAGSIDLGDWTITQTGSDLKFAHNGTDRLKLSSAGALTAEGDITAVGNA